MLPGRIKLLQKDVMSRSTEFIMGYDSAHDSWDAEPNIWARDVALKRSRQQGRMKTNFLKKPVNSSGKY
jgi:hypothetical protein